MFFLSSTKKGQKVSKGSFFPHRGQSLVLPRVSLRYARVSYVSTYAVHHRFSPVLAKNKLLLTCLTLPIQGMSSSTDEKGI